MSRPKRGSKVLDQAQRRVAGLKSINTTLDLGNGLTIEALLGLIQESRQKLETYNMALSMVDQNYNTFLESERSLSEFCQRMMNGVASKYGKNSDEYQMAGGARPTKRRVTQRTAENKIPTSVVVAGTDNG